MPPPFRSTSFAMKNDDQRRRFGWALPASVTVHALAVALLIFGLPVSLFETEQEKPIDVELVPPPEQPKQAQAAKAEPPPAPKPPPPEAKAEEAQEKQPEKKPETGKEDAKTAPENVLEPVHRFGEKDGGPKVAPDGDSASEASAEAEAEKPEPEKPEVAKTDDPAEVEKPEVAKPEPEKKDAAQPKELTAARSPEQTPLAKEAETPAAKPAPKPKKAAKAEQTKKLASRMNTGDAIATTAMGGLPRDVRGGRLCVTELRERMRNASPPYFPDLLPSYPLESGNVLDIPRAAFRLGGAWYELSFRCEVDSNATQVLVFNFRVGGPIPPGEWKRRGLPAR